MSNNTSCDFGQEYSLALSNIEFITYDFLPPAQILLGVPGHAISILAFYRRSKKEKAYIFQLFTSISELMHIFSLTSFLYAIAHLSGQFRTGKDWFMGNYYLMWYAAYLNVPILHTFVTLALLSSFSMTIDRVLAMAIPFKYKNFKHTRNQTLVIIVCILISMATSIFDAFRQVLVSIDDQKYTIAYNIIFTNTAFAKFSAQFRNGLRAAGVFGLITANAILVYLYKLKGKQMAQMSTNVQNEQQRKSREKTLLVLTVSQSVFTSLAVLGEVAVLYCLYAFQWFAQCYQGLGFGIADSVTQISNVSEFYLALSISQEFRRNVAKLLGCKKHGNQVTTLTVSAP